MANTIPTNSSLLSEATHETRSGEHENFLSTRVLEIKKTLLALGICSLETITFDMATQKFILPASHTSLTGFCVQYCKNLSLDGNCSRILEETITQIKADIATNKRWIETNIEHNGMVLGLSSDPKNTQIIFVLIFPKVFKKRILSSEFMQALSSLAPADRLKIVEAYHVIPTTTFDTDKWQQKLTWIKNFVMQLTWETQELPMINDLVKDLNASKFDRQKILRKIREASVRLTGAGRGCLVMDEHDNGKQNNGLENNDCWIPCDQKTGFCHKRLKDRKIYKEVLATGKPILINNAKAPWVSEEYEFDDDVYSELNVPIIHEGYKFGVIHVSSDAQDTFTPHHVDLLEAFAGHAAIALDNAHIFQKTLQQDKVHIALSNELFNLMSLSAPLVLEKNLNKLFFLFLTGLTHHEGCGFSRAFLFLADEGKGELIGRMGLGSLTNEEASQTWGEIKNLSLEEALKNYESTITNYKVKDLNRKLTKIVLSTRKFSQLIKESSQCYNNLDSLPETKRKKLDILNIQAPFAVIPLKSGGNLLGIIIIDCSFSEKITEITKQDLGILDLFAGQLAVALENSFFHKENVVLNTISQALTGQLLNWDKLIKEIVKAVRKHLPALRCSIFLMDIGGKRLELMASTGSPSEAKALKEGKSINYKWGEGLTGWIAKKGKVLRLKHCGDKDELKKYGKDIRWTGRSVDEEAEEENTAFLGVPIKIEDKVKGVIRVARKPGDYFTYQEERLLEILASHLAIILESAEQIKTLKESVYQLGHDCYTPMSNLESLLDRIKEKKVPEGREEKYLNMAIANSKRFRHMVDNLYYLGRLDLGILKLDKQLIEITPNLDGCLAFLLSEEVRERKQLKIKKNKPDHLEKVWADKEALKSILCNLLSNAIKHSDKGHDIQINVSDNPDYVVFEVINFGPVIEQEKQTVIFSRSPLWYKDSKGLGLLIAKQLVKKQGGEIWVESDREKGTRFSFSLPKQKKGD